MAKIPQDRNLHLVAAVIFGIVTLVHAIRLAANLPLTVGTWRAPLWLSWLGVVVAGYLSVLFWKTAHR
ncbi:MAG TPA: hypothetical protein VJK52_03590 [Candidatus Nanoarchaeia archaeon]|nr:hypothetical protein [Candidatus Nanoarchaeia archaeon]